MSVRAIISGLFFAVMLALLAFVVIGSLPKPEPEPPAVSVLPLPGGKPAPREWKGLSLREAMHWEKLGGNRNVLCVLCPRFCEVEPGKRGECRVRVNLDGALYTLVHGKPVATNVDPIEKKPLNQFLPGAKAFSIATAGCNLGCIFCQNWQISQTSPERARSTTMSPIQVVAVAKARGCEAIAYTYTEPTIFYEYMLETAKAAREAGLKNLLITCGYINPDPLKELCQVVDAANIDLKGFSEDFYRDYCKSELAPVLASIKTAKEAGVWVEITNLVIPGANDDPKMIRDMCVWIRENVGPDVPLHFSAFHPAYKLLDRPRTPAATLVKAREIAREEGLRYVYIGNVAARDGGTTFCPKCGKPVIVRKGFFIEEMDIKNGRCAHCDHEIAGVWRKQTELEF